MNKMLQELTLLSGDGDGSTSEDDNDDENDKNAIPKDERLTLDNTVVLDHVILAGSTGF
jgi:hypothetical protein